MDLSALYNVPDTMPLMGWVQAIPYILQGASLLGGLMGKSKTIDPAFLERLYGPGAMAQKAADYANAIGSSAYGQQILGDAAAAGQGMEQAMAARAAQAGMTPATGGQSGAGDFSQAASGQAATNLMRGVKSQFYQQGMQQAQDFAAKRLALEEQRRKEPNMWEKIGNAASVAGSMSLMGMAKGGKAGGTKAEVPPAGEA